MKSDMKIGFHASDRLRISIPDAIRLLFGRQIRISGLEIAVGRWPRNADSEREEKAMRR